MMNDEERLAAGEIRQRREVAAADMQKGLAFGGPNAGGNWKSLIISG